jgi:very-short-patch-repair endonuclease
MKLTPKIGGWGLKGNLAVNPKRKTTSRIRGTTPEIEAAARRLRRNMTPAEKKLWEALRGKQLGGLKFRAQHPVGPFILDFYCPACKLAVELDGGVHEDQTAHDEARTRQLNDYGYNVIRFRNEEVLGDLPSVLEQILAAARGLSLPP